MTIDFKYMKEVTEFLHVLFLGAILSFVVMYIVEAAKKYIKNVPSKVFVLIAFAVSMAFGLAWAYTFAEESISLPYALWLGVCLFLGSQGFYKHLEESDGFLGKFFNSYKTYHSGETDDSAPKDENGSDDDESGDNTQNDGQQDVQTPLPDEPSKDDDIETEDPQTGSDYEPIDDTEEVEPKEGEIPEGYITKHFRLGEFKCECGGKYCNGYNGYSAAQASDRLEALCALLEKIRAEANRQYPLSSGKERPLYIKSGIRCARINSKVGGSKTSYHLKAMAADISVPGISSGEICKKINKNGGVGTGAGHYPHVDVRGYKAHWTY